MEKTTKITSCVQCPHHSVIADPDPHDWFNDDDVAVVCKKTEQEPDLESEYRADRQKHKVISSGDRPYQITESNIQIPKWCPLK